MARVVIAGGGLSGLVAAERLAKRDIPAVVLEREREPGGACRSINRDGFVFDHTAHLLHLGRPESERYLRELDVWSSLVRHERRAAIVVGEHATPYPIQINTHGLAPEVRRDCVLGFIHAWTRSREQAPESFRDWVLDRFGEGFARHFFFPYNRKLYRAEPGELSLDWVGRYLPKPELDDVVDGAFGLYREPVGYNATFLYPECGGIRLLPDRIAARVLELRLGTEIVAISLGERWLELGNGERLTFENLVATLALPQLLHLVVDRLPPEIVDARSTLRWVQVANLALGVAGPPPRAEHWLYFPDPDVPFYRLGIPSNHGAMAPEGCHTLSVEVSLDPGAQEDEEVAAAEQVLVARGLLDPAEVKIRLLTALDPAYVVFDHRRKDAVGRIRSFLRSHQVLLCGRWAEWKYSAMEDALLDGMSVARRLARMIHAQ